MEEGGGERKRDLWGNWQREEDEGESRLRPTSGEFQMREERGKSAWDRQRGIHDEKGGHFWMNFPSNFFLSFSRSFLFFFLFLLSSCYSSSLFGLKTEIFAIFHFPFSPLYSLPR